SARRMSSSRRAGRGRPEACQRRGYIEMAVNPGSVLSSLTRTRPVPRSRKKSTRAIPETPQTRNARTARSRTVAAGASGNGRWPEQLRAVLNVLVFVVVELAPGDDLPDSRGLRLVVPEDGALELTRVDSLLHERPFVEREGAGDRRRHGVPALDLRDADG